MYSLPFSPPFVHSDTTLEIDKIGSWIDPTDVLPFNGSNFHLHALNSGVRWTGIGSTGRGGMLMLETLDVALVSIGGANPAPTSARDGNAPYLIYPRGRVGSTFSATGRARKLNTSGMVPDAAGGAHFSLSNNLWNTNYPFWYPFQREERNVQYRFRLHASLPDDAQ